MWPVVRAVLVVASVHVVSATCLAQEAAIDDGEARRLFEEGAEAFANGNYRVALDKFLHSHELSGRAELLFNVGLAHDRLREDALALRAFEGYLERVPDAANRAEVEGRIAELRRVIADRDRVAVADGGGSIFTEWWLWAIVGAVVVVGIIAAVVLAGDRVQDPMPGSTGEVSHAVLAW